MSETYQAFYQNEIRALQITINDQDGAAMAPSAAWVQIQDSTGAEVIAEQAAQVTANTVATLIGTTVTGTVGKYKIIWRISHNVHTYYHVSELEVMEL